MKITKNLIVIASGLLCLAITIWFSTLSHAQSNKVYEITASPMVPNGYTPSEDTNRLTDLISQLIDQNQQLNQNQLADLNVTLQALAQKLDTIDKGISAINTRIEAIEKALKIEKPKASHEASPALKEENTDKKEARDLSKSSIAD